MQTISLEKGTLLQRGKYRIEETIGQGGFGVTYRATQVALNRPVAIKEYFMKEYCDRSSHQTQVTAISQGAFEMVASFKAKFLKEAQMIASLDHPNVIPIHDIFEENGTAYYVMDYIPGGNLKQLVQCEGKLSESKALKLINQISKALMFLHNRQILHLDVKPANVMLRTNGDVVLIDFGLSKHYDESGQQTTSSPVGISCGYAPLEQYMKGGVGQFSAATDVYSLGATLYYLLSATNPPEPNEFIDTGLSPLPNVSESVNAAIIKAMQPSRAKRYQSVPAFMKDLSVEAQPAEMSDDIQSARTAICNLISNGSYQLAYDICLEQRKKKRDVEWIEAKIKEILPPLKAAHKDKMGKKRAKAIIWGLVALVLYIILIAIIVANA